MNLGTISIGCSFLLSVTAAVLFFIRGRKTQSETGPSPYRAALLLYQGSVFMIALASAYLFYLLFTHQFQYTYVARYSSLHQPVFYLISAFWAGQEGTFLLWALLVAVMGAVFLQGKEDPDGPAMGTVAAFLGFLSLLMVVKSPFAATMNVPSDGSGMNPLLQNFWMVVHPPVLFVGYAAAVFPFALALSALIRGSYGNWFASGYRWTLFAASLLGAGIIIGGFWAYEVLGWGGYWGWDPVENSSLVPWMTLLALVHGFIVQKNRGGLVRTNLLLALISFILVLYATFLTRSGILQDFSVHSFEDLGIGGYLIAALCTGLAAGVGLFLIRFRSIRPPKLHLGLNRELALILSIFVILGGAVFTFFGMSSPIVTGLFGKASQVDISYYNRVNLPVAIAMALLLGITPFVGWAAEQTGPLMKRLSLPLLLTLLAGVIARVAGVTSPALLIFAGAAAFGLISNTIIAFRQYRSGWWNLGGPVTHIGVGLLFLGIIGSGSFDETKRLQLKQGEAQEAFGYRFLFRELTDVQSEKPQIHIEVSDDKTIYMAAPRLYFSEYNKAVMREPDIRILPLKDIYISPLEITMPEDDSARGPVLELTKGETKNIGGYSITFTRFDVGQHGDQAAMSVGAVLSVTAAGRTSEVTPVLSFNGGKPEMRPADLPTSGGGTAPQIALMQVNVDEKKVYLTVTGLDHPATPPQQPLLLVEISLKPLMMVVWTGVVLIVAGSLMSYRRRLKRTEGNIGAF